MKKMMRTWGMALLVLGLVSCGGNAASSSLFSSASSSSEPSFESSISSEESFDLSSEESSFSSSVDRYEGRVRKMDRSIVDLSNAAVSEIPMTQYIQNAYDKQYGTGKEGEYPVEPLALRVFNRNLFYFIMDKYYGLANGTNLFMKTGGPNELDAWKDNAHFANMVAGKVIAIAPWWQTLLTTLTITSGVLAAGALAMAIVSIVKSRKEQIYPSLLSAFRRLWASTCGGRSSLSRVARGLEFVQNK